LGKVDEAIAEIKKILFKNLTNFTCWHAMGIIYRKVGDYDQARRAYQNALKYAPENDNVMRDLSNMQLHLREFEGFLETRRQMLLKDATKNEAWSAFILALYIQKQYEQCASAIDSFLQIDGNPDNKRPISPPEKNELFVLKAKSLVQQKKFAEALDFVQKSPAILNKYAKFELEAQSYSGLGKTEEAIDAYERLLELNSVNFETYYKILRTHGLDLFDQHGKPKAISQADQDKLREIMKKYQEGLPKVDAPIRV
jgi:peptide alpha-N-acetyltransferase